jgi:hypothetical protein
MGEKIALVRAIIDAAGLIITAVITGLFGLVSSNKKKKENEGGQGVEAPKDRDMVITVKDTQGRPLQADLYITNITAGTELTKKTTNEQGVVTLLGLPKGRYTVRAESAGFTQTVRDFDQHNSELRIEMNKEPPPQDSPFNMAGWIAWGGITASVRGNVVTFNGNVSTGGYVNASVSRHLAGRILILSFGNTGKSGYSDSRLLKMTVNKDDHLLEPLNEMVLIYNEYIPAGDRRVEYRIPQDFNGKLGMVFYNADLKNLRISVFYR